MFCRFLQAWVQTPSPNFKSLKIKFQIGIFLDTMLSLKSYLINNLLPQPPHLRVAVNGSDTCPKVPMGILLFSEHDFIPRLVPIAGSLVYLLNVTCRLWELVEITLWTLSEGLSWFCAVLSVSLIKYGIIDAWASLKLVYVCVLDFTLIEALLEYLCAWTCIWYTL